MFFFFVTFMMVTETNVLSPRNDDPTKDLVLAISGVISLSSIFCFLFYVFVLRRKPLKNQKVEEIIDFDGDQLKKTPTASYPKVLRIGQLTFSIAIMTVIAMLEYLLYEKPAEEELAIVMRSIGWGMFGLGVLLIIDGITLKSFGRKNKNKNQKELI